MEDEQTSPAPPTFFQQFGPALILGGVSLFCIIASLILLFKTTQTSEPIRFSGDQASSSALSRTIMVDIEGAIEKPGVYTLSEGSRVEDILQKSGGLTGEADIEWVGKTLNRASLLSDGAKIYIPKKGQVQGQSAMKTENGESSSVKALEGGQNNGGLISINMASEKDLDTLSGVGPVTAEKIINNRPYQRIEELLEKKVLTPSVYEKVKGQLTL